MQAAAVVYLRDEAVVVNGVTFYGSPWQPWFYAWAFNLPRSPQLRAKWGLIPPRVRPLADLLEVVEQIWPTLHIFGHIHEGIAITTNTLLTAKRAGERLCLFRISEWVMLRVFVLIVIVDVD